MVFRGVRRGEGIGDGADEGFADIGGAAKADLSLGGMNIDVHLLGRKVDEEYRGGTCLGACAWAGLADGIADDRGRGGATVHEGKLVVPEKRAAVRALDVTVDGHGRTLSTGRIGYWDKRFCEWRPEEIVNAFFKRSAGREAVGLAAIKRQG